MVPIVAFLSGVEVAGSFDPERLDWLLTTIRTFRRRKRFLGLTPYSDCELEAMLEPWLYGPQGLVQQMHLLVQGARPAMAES